MGADLRQVRGKKNLVIEKALAGPVGILVKFSTLQEHGVDKVFVVENDNVDASQKNVIFLARGEKATAPIAIAGMLLTPLILRFETWFVVSFRLVRRVASLKFPMKNLAGSQSRVRRPNPLYLFSLDPKSSKFAYTA